MPMPRDLGVIDLMLSIPTDDTRRIYDFLTPQLMDAESRDYKMPAQHLFKGVPSFEPGSDFVKVALDAMDRHGVERALIPVAEDDRDALRALREHPDRFSGSVEVNPNRGMQEVRRLVSLHETLGVAAASAFPCGLLPQVPIDDKRFFPLYAKCVELDLPICVCVGVPGPRIPMSAQHVERIDEVCWYFPELKFVMRHGAEPWTDLAVKLMLKYPNLFYSTSAFAPKHYPRDILHYANTRGADRVMYAGYFPMGMTLDRIFSELPDVPLKDEVWPRFLRENARRVFGFA